jgi:hypothetical protein
MDVNQDLTVCKEVNVSYVAYILVQMTESQDTFGCCQERNVESCNKLPAVLVCDISDMHCPLPVCLFRCWNRNCRCLQRQSLVRLNIRPGCEKLCWWTGSGCSHKLEREDISWISA